MSDEQRDEQVSADVRALAMQMLRDPVQLRALLAEATERLELMHQEIVEARPKVEFAEAVMQSADWAEMAAVAKLLGRKGWGRNSLFDLLRSRGILRYNNEPYQEYVNRGYFKVVEQTWMNPQSGESMVNRKTVVSQRGIDFIRRILEAETRGEG